MELPYPNIYLLATEILVLLRESEPKSVVISDSLVNLLIQRLNVPVEMAFEVDQQYNDLMYEMSNLILDTPRDAWKAITKIDRDISNAINVLSKLNLIDEDFENKTILLKPEESSAVISQLNILDKEPFSSLLDALYAPILHKSSNEAIKYWNSFSLTSTYKQSLKITYCAVCGCSPCMCSDPFKSSPTL